MNELPLRDIHLPDSISWWPPAIGWWLLPLLLILIIAAFYLYRRYRKQHKTINYQKAALSELSHIEKQFPETHSMEYLRQISALLRRIMLSYYPRENVASLTGERWFEELHKLSKGDFFSAEQQLLILQAAYRPSAEFDRTALQKTCKQWIEALPKNAVMESPQ